VEGVEHLVVAEDWHVLGLRLGDQHPVERILMGTRQQAGASVRWPALSPALEFIRRKRSEERWCDFEFAFERSGFPRFGRRIDGYETHDWIPAAGDDDLLAKLRRSNELRDVGFCLVDGSAMDCGLRGHR
jgi:hypothetical protein